MFHKNIKLILATLFIGAGIWSFTDGEIGNGIFYIFLSLFPIFLYFKNKFRHQVPPKYRSGLQFSSVLILKKSNNNHLVEVENIL